MDETFILNELKSLILTKTGIKTITPADCKRISIEISKTLNKNVSETTIKRLFGFAMVKHNFSKFTLTTLSEYVNDEYLETSVANTGITHNTPRSWKDIHDKACKISEFTIKAIKNRSGMPYEMTISRKFSEHDFEIFYKSDYSFTSYISQPGYGRSILLSHLGEKLMSNDRSLFNDSTLLFTTTSTLYTNEKISLNFEDQLKAQLGIQPKDSLITYAADNYELSGGKLVIFLDGFSDIELKRDLKKQLFDSIINFICAIENNKAIKLVMSMRSTTWVRFYNEIRHSAYLKTKWFPGSYFNLNELSNVPPLTEKEVDQIISKIIPLRETEINPKLKDQLKFPFHIQLYYQLKKEDPNFHYSTNITFYELIFRLIQNQIYRANYYTEKILFLKKVILLTDFGKNGSSVLKDDLISDLLAFKNAYMELLSDGILMEEKSNEEFHPKEHVKFIHPHIFEYFLFIEILEKFNLKIDRSYFDFINREYKNETTRFQLLQWTIRFIVRIGDFKSLPLIFDLELNNYERNYLILFIAENLHYRSKNNPETNSILHEHKFHDTIIKELMNFDFVDSFYKEAVSVLIKITDDEENLLIYNSLLSMFDMLSLNTDQIKNRIAILSKLSSGNWLVPPHRISQLVYNKITGTNEVNESFLNDIQKLISSQTSEEITIEQAISYVLMILLSLFYDYQEETIKIVTLISNQHPKIFTNRSQFSIFMISILAFTNSISNPGKKTDQLENILAMLDEDKSRYRINKYTEVIIKLIQANQLKIKKDYTTSYQYCLDCLQIFKRNNLNLNCIYVYNLIIEIFTELGDVTKANDYKYDMLCFIEDNKISNKFYILTNEPKKF
ncbi:hypothetical protein [Pedobacter ginsengisoli]|uniref:hypothetical protein n=1 Tax=Pedobacter ginsengisoli TaxID=363852 RepID=UPI00254ED828|nr:hypothetical protein [Pedobacter ginsengisoli]